MKCTRYHLTAVICMICIIHLAEPLVFDQDDLIIGVTETSVGIMSWNYRETLPDRFYSRLIEKKNGSIFKVVLDYYPFDDNLELSGVFENKNVTYFENADTVTVTVYDVEEQFHGEYRFSMLLPSGSTVHSGQRIFFYCRTPREANLIGPPSQIIKANIVLTCEVESTSLSDEYRKNVTRIFYWKVDDKLVDEDGTHVFSNDAMENSVNSSLTIMNISVEMKGKNYTCFAVEEGCEIKSPSSSGYVLQPEDPNTLTSSLVPDDTSVDTVTPTPTEDPSVTQPSSTPTSDDLTPTPHSGWSHWYILLIALSCLVILVVIAVVIHRRSQRTDNDLNPVTELKPSSVHAAPADHVRANTAGYRPSQLEQPRREDNMAYYVQGTSGARL